MSITVKADTTSDILSKYAYKKYVVDNKGHYHVFLSTASFQSTIFSSMTVYDLNIGKPDTISQAEYLISTVTYPSSIYPIALTYDGYTWEIEIPVVASKSATALYWIFIADALISSSSDTKPSGFPTVDLDSGVTIDEVQAEINSALNATTSATTSAKNIQTEITNNYIQYNNGDISLTQLQANIDSLVQQLQNLNNLSNTTISDKIAINNAITQTQIVQDAANKDAIIKEMEEDLTVSSSTSSAITGKINEANTVFNNYSQGDTTQSEAVTQINQYITYLTNLITPEMPTADIEAINAGINTINGIKDSIVNHSELDPEVSDKSQASDKEEMEYLNNLEAETTDNIDSLKSKVDSSINEAQANQIKNNVITPILQNTLLTKILPISALFMVLAVTLGFKYRL